MDWRRFVPVIDEKPADAPEYVQDIYRNSKQQQKLADFIENNLKEYIYRGKEYEKKYDKEGLTKLRKLL